MIGKQLAHYEITSELGKGGMGEVWQALDTKLGRSVAIKTLPEAFAQDDERLSRFEREAKLLASLNHPNIASIYGLEEADGTRFLVLELVEGETLAERLERGPVPLEECMRLAIQIAEALEAAHETGVVHRDLKPANVKVTPDGKVKVLDFGLAKALAGDELEANVSNSPTLSRQATIAGVILGTAAYMSPEQAKGIPVDRRSDVFSFGCVLFEMLSGRRAFQGDLATEILASVIKEVPDESLLPARMHPGLKELLRRCLEKDARNRWQAVGDIRLELSRIAADPEGASLVSVISEPPPPAARVVLPWVAATAVVVGLATWVVRPAPPSEPKVVSRFTHELAEGRQFTNVGRTLVAISRDGMKIAYVANRQLFLREAHELEARPIQGTEGNATMTPVFSPDGDWLGFFSDDGGQTRLKKIPVSGGTPIALSDASEYPFGMSWTDRGSILYGQSEGIFEVSDAGGSPTLVVPAEEDEVFGPRLLPGANVVLFASTRETGSTSDRWDAGQIVVQSLDSGERKVVWNGGSDARYVASGHLVYANRDALYAVPFDLDRLEVSGGSVLLTEGVRRGSAGTAHYDVSDSGTLVYVAGEAANRSLVLALAGSDGSVQRLGVPPARYVSPRVSPDGRSVVVQTDDEDESVIWIYELSGDTAIRRLTFEGSNTRPLWTPDGEWITFASDRDGTRSIYRKRADGSGIAERLTTAEEGTYHDPWAWSPDGRTLAYVVGVPDTNEEIWTLTFGENEPEEPRILASLPRLNQGPAFSPDGKWIAYIHTGTDRNLFQVYVEPFPPTGTRHRITRESGAFPVWSPDGSKLIFRPSGVIGVVRAVDITTEPALRFSDARDLPIAGFEETLGFRSYDPMPDGERFVMVYPPEETTPATARPTIHVVLNWMEEVRARVPTSLQ